ncbi:HD-GYP domain-containing protein [Desulfobacterium sp. N47]|uniref:Response regulator receiver modulated metal dependent phosphohydrolase n=1 Tax=uncultured Desulfobacterium sp. TaxID=201089 RepID=E1Y9P6_9BACT|nr:hypothetical protein N47_I07100 [uncultured Desulfobacterium sp.]
MEPAITGKKILIIDDDESVLRTLKRIIDKIRRECVLASSAEEARRILEQESFDLVLCDIRLPGESGMDLVRHILSGYPETAVIVVSGLDDPDVAEKALEIGVYGFIVKPFKVSEVIINVSNALRRQKLESESRRYRENLEQLVAVRTEKLQDTLDGLIKVVAGIVESKDPYTAGHQRKVAELACAIACEMDFATDQVKGILMAGTVHDLGKVAVPSEILSKPGRLSNIEFAIIKEHPQVGYDILKGIDFPWPVAMMVLQHHERMDGSGYPCGLKGNEILPEARILMVADVMEAMASHRPYRPLIGIDIALEEIAKNKGILYEPDVVDACINLFSKKNFCFTSS